MKGKIDFPQDLVAGIEYLFKARNKAEHKQDMDKAGFLGHFRTVAKTIEFFSKVPIPKEIQDILDGENRKDSPDRGRKSDKQSQTKSDSQSSSSGDEKDSFEQLKKDMDKCTKCDRCNPIKVLYNGSITSKVMFIAQNPGDFPDGRLLVNDETGENFQELLDHIKWQRENIFITNAVLCHVPKGPTSKKNDPTTEQIENCNDYLKRLINLVNPKVIVTLGGVAFKAINKIKATNIKFGKDSFAKEIVWNGRKLFLLYLPIEPFVIPKLKTMDEFKKAFKKLDSIVDPITGLK